MDKGPKPAFDLNGEISSPHYFKSSFAKSMAVDCMKQSKSLDNAFLDKPHISEKYVSGDSQSVSLWATASGNASRKYRGLTETSVVCNGGKVMQNECDFARVVSLRNNNRSRCQTTGTDPVKLWKTNKKTSGSLGHQNDKNSSDQQQQHSPGGSYTESDVLRLRKECQSLVEENRRLQAALDLRTPRRSVQTIDATILQSQVDTLQWQLKQAESSRQMYRAVMEQVVRFLERAYKNLDLIKNKMDPGGRRGKPSPSRVPRSRSVHTVDASPSRAASPQPDTSSQVPRAKSIAQIEASPNYSNFRDFTWRRPRQPLVDPEEVPPEKLSQEAFRLLRTAQSLLNTREPDLAQRLCPGLEPETVPDHDSISSHRSSLALSIPGQEDEPLQNKREPLSLSTTSCNSLLRQTLDNSSLRSIPYNNSPLTSGLESAFAGGCRTTSPPYTPSLSRPRKCKTPSPPIPETSYPPRSSPPASSTEDESGFSSMNSFQEVGLPLVSPSPTPSYSISSNHSKQTSLYHQPCTTNTENSVSQSMSYSTSGFQEVGLPIVEHPPVPNHRRWSSSPAEALTQFSKHNASFCGAGETLRVLWV